MNTLDSQTITSKSLSKPLSHEESTAVHASFHQDRDEFRGLLNRTMERPMASGLPKLELTGILVPCSEVVNGYRCKYKIETSYSDYFLSVSDALALVAKRLTWEEVTVKGFLDPDDDVFEVEKINLTNKSEPFRLMTGPRDLSLELDLYRRAIAQRGKLELAPEFLGS